MRIQETPPEGEPTPTLERDARTWELRRKYSWGHLAIALGYTVLAGKQRWWDRFTSSLADDFDPRRSLTDLLIVFSLLMLIWFYWHMVVNFLFLFSARRITVSNLGNEPRIEIDTWLPLQRRIASEQIRKVSLAGRRHVGLSYDASTSLWRFVRAFAIMPSVAISRRQFSDDLSWQSFRNAIPNELLRSSEPPEITTSNFPPTYLEVPCSSCGLKIPTYEDRCPNCATRRPV